jgi:hypothetical protein
MSETQNISMNVEPETNSGTSETVTQAVPSTQVQPESKNVNVNLLTNIKSILEISTGRGTFKANELTAVGKVYDEILTLLQ